MDYGKILKQRLSNWIILGGKGRIQYQIGKGRENAAARNQGANIWSGMLIQASRWVDYWSPILTLFSPIL